MINQSTVEFTCLPLDVIEHITSYLNTNDLLTCSLVNSAWRKALNNDILWVKRCKGSYGWKCYAEYLEDQKSHVEPVFNLPQSPENTLEPLCKWRVHFMTQIHLRRNLQANRHKKFIVDGNFNTDRTIYYDSDNIVVIPSESNGYEIWNTDGLPFCEDVIYGAINNADQFVYVYGNYVVILQFNLLQVFENSDHKLKLLHRKLFDEPEKLSLDLPSSLNLTEWYWNVYKVKSILPAYNKKICFENIFIGVNCDSDLKNRVFHVWDLKKGVKLKEQTFVDLSNIVCDLYFYKTAELVYVVFETKDSNNERQITILGYNPTRQTYTNLCIEINHCSHNQRYFFFDANYVITLRSNIIDVWDSTKNNKKQCFKDTETSPFPFALVIYKTELIYAGNGYYSNRLTFLNLETLQIIKTLILCSPIYKLVYTKPNLLLIKANAVCGIDEYEISVWNLKDILNNTDPELRVHSFKVREQFSGSLKLSKLISIQPHQFCVTHFW